MGVFKGSLPVCPRNQHCAHWARIYLKYCLCGVKDGASLSLGLVSVISWGLAEVPQIITNYREKSTEGLSIGFLMTWVVGDLFNLIGCKLEPATLLTQYYMALLYTATTLILVSQTVYYCHIYHWLKATKIGWARKVHGLQEEETVSKENEDIVYVKKYKFEGNQTKGSSIVQDGLPQPSSPIPVSSRASPHNMSQERNMYYRSARSLTKSHTPPAGSYLARSRDFGGTAPYFVDNHSAQEPLLSGPVNLHSAPPSNTKRMLCLVSAATLLFGFDLSLSLNSRFNEVTRKPHSGIVIKVGRKLLESNSGLSLIQDGAEGNGIGTYLGWAMAAIYMGGRLPQICLNIRRGNVEGLNPLMFTFALFGNLTYVASILVDSLDWSKIGSNLPWLVDAGGCVILDSFILAQFIYFSWRKSPDSKSDHDHFVAA